MAFQNHMIYQLMRYKTYALVTHIIYRMRKIITELRNTPHNKKYKKWMLRIVFPKSQLEWVASMIRKLEELRFERARKEAGLDAEAFAGVDRPLLAENEVTDYDMVGFQKALLSMFY